jgi:hypothetical protein
MGARLPISSPSGMLGYANQAKLWDLEFKKAQNKSSPPFNQEPFLYCT